VNICLFFSQKRHEQAFYPRPEKEGFLRRELTSQQKKMNLVRSVHPFFFCLPFATNAGQGI